MNNDVLGINDESTLYETYRAACIKHENFTQRINGALNLASVPEIFAEREVAYAEMRLAEKRLYLKIVGNVKS